MRNIQDLDRHLLQSEFEAARSLYEQARGQGYAPLKAAAIVYRQGLLEGRDSMQKKILDVHRKMNILKAQCGIKPDAVTDEGSDCHDEE